MLSLFRFKEVLKTHYRSGYDLIRYLKLRYVKYALLLFLILLTYIFFSPKPPLLNKSFSTAVFDEKHHLLRLSLSQDGYYRVFTPLAAIDPALVEATLLQEDRYFFQHWGINPWALIRAVWQTYISHSRRVGASTITMQVAHLTSGSSSKSVMGKLRQIVRSLQLERYYSKNEILEAYLNLAPYGHNIEGVGAASLIYFQRSVKALALKEALILSVIPQNPNHRAPDSHNIDTIVKQLWSRWLVMHPSDQRFLAQFQLASQIYSIRNLPFEAPHFVQYVLSKFNDVTLVTTLDRQLQHLVERVTQQYLARKKGTGVHNAAVLLVDTRDSSVKAWLGSANFFDKAIQGQINGVEIKRSPGSTLKPFIYGLAMDQGLIHPYSVLNDVPYQLGSYNPENFDYDFLGPLKAKDALILSRNIPAIALTRQLKNPSLYHFLEMTEVRDLKSEAFYGLSLSLGGVALSMKELANLYLLLAKEGEWQPLHFLKKEKQKRGLRLLSPEASFLVLDMLKDTARPISSVLQKTSVSWKTGTSAGFRDAWTVGIAGPYVLAVWLGDFNYQGNPSLIGKEIAAPLFFEILEAMEQSFGALAVMDKHPETLRLTQLLVCKASGMLPTPLCPEVEMTWFIPGVSPIQKDTLYREIAINGNTGLRTCHVDRSTRFEVYEFWPSDVLKLFKQAGIRRRIPPPYEVGCFQHHDKGLRPRISSPQTELVYFVHDLRKDRIPLSVITDADVSKVYWFMNNEYLGSVTAGKPLLWNANSGHFRLHVVDDHGRSDSRDVVIQLAEESRTGGDIASSSGSK